MSDKIYAMTEDQVKGVFLAGYENGKYNEDLMVPLQTLANEVIATLPTVQPHGVPSVEELVRVQVMQVLSEVADELAYSDGWQTCDGEDPPDITPYEWDKISTEAGKRVAYLLTHGYREPVEGVPFAELEWDFPGNGSIPIPEVVITGDPTDLPEGTKLYLHPPIATPPPSNRVREALELAKDELPDPSSAPKTTVPKAIRAAIAVRQALAALAPADKGGV